MPESKGYKDVFTCCKLEIFIPESHLEVLEGALQDVDAGHIGNYDSCMSYSKVMSCWRPLEGSTPYIGRCGDISREPEMKVEVTCLTDRLRETLAAIKRVHPYEEPVINVIPLYMTGWNEDREWNAWCRKMYAITILYVSGTGCIMDISFWIQGGYCQ